MHRVGARVTALAAAVTTALFGSTVVASPAIADEQVVVCAPETGQCTVIVEDDGAPGRGRDRDRGQGASSGPVVDDGPSIRDLCFYQLANPQPPASDPAWGGNDPATGQIYLKSCPMTRDSEPTTSTVFVANGAAPPIVVTPAQLAQRAVESLELPDPKIKRSPSERNGDSGVPYTWVNLWTWVWTSPATWRPLSESASAGPVFAEVTVTPEQLIFDPGDGSAPVSCPGPGRPWRKADGNDAPSDGGCGYRYRHVTTGGPLTATLSIRWVVTWTGSGEAGGTLPAMTTSTSSTFEVQQLQAVTR